MGRKLLFVFPLTNAQLDVEWFGKHSEAMSDEIVTAMSIACASIFLFELF